MVDEDEVSYQNEVEMTFSSSPGRDNLHLENEMGSESGVEPDYAEWVFDSEEVPQDNLLLDLSNEQALATLKYFTSTADRTNMMTKFHGNDLDLISQLLTDKEKDLALAAQIGQSLLQRNKTLMEKIEKMEEYLSNTRENEEQLKYDLQHKADLVKMYYEEQDEMRSFGSIGSKDDFCDDEDLYKLTKRCRDLEKENHNLFSEALNMRQMTDEIEEKEESLVFDCIEQLSEAKSQITKLTDEIAQKFEDNVQQQEEITQLINAVVELQRKQKQLSVENEELQTQLMYANEQENDLKEQLMEMQAKFRETYELLQENQEQMKTLKSKLEDPGHPTEWLSDSSNSISLHDSLANEIEETVRRDLNFTQETRQQNKKVFENVKFLNTRAYDGLSRSTSGRTSPSSNWSFASDERSETASVSGSDLDNRTKKAARKLQIVKPLEGSDTLNKWQHLASQNVVGGLNIAEEATTPARSNISFDDDRETIVEEDRQAAVVSSDSSSARDEKSSVKKSVRNTSSNVNSLMNLLSTPNERKTTILTRNSTALNSLRKGRRMLSGQDTEGKSKSEVIDMIANAMSKVNLEAHAGERIISSLKSETKGRERALSSSKSPELKDFKDMPRVSRILEKASKARESEEGSEATLSPDHRSFSPKDKQSRLPLDDPLNSITGPLGLLSRANPTDNNVNIMERLHRFSSIQTTAPEAQMLTKAASIDRVSDTDFDSGVSVGGSTDTTIIRRNQSSGSLVDMMIGNKLQNGLRPLGMASLMNSSTHGYTTGNIAGLTGLNVASKSVDNINLVTSVTQQKTSKSVAAGLDNVKTSENEKAPPSGGYGGFFSFLGKFT